MKNIKSFLKRIDGFGVPYFFRYKTKKNFTTSLGGLVTILFIILVFCFVIYYLVPFDGKKNFTILYYTTNIRNPEPINLMQSKSIFSFGLICENDIDNINVNNLLDLESKFITIKNTDGNSIKTIVNISSHSCTLSDFNNDYNEVYNKLNLVNHKCLDKNDFIVEGSFSDEIYSYYEFNLKSKSNSKENINNINKLLQNNECKIQFIYIDINMNLNNYKNPIKYFLNSYHIELYQDLLIIQNIYLMNQYLFNDDKIFSVFNEDNSNPERYISFSRFEQYLINRDNPNNYAKICLKADNRKTYIKRKYQKFIEFYADISSIFVSVFSLLMIIVNFFNSFLAEFSLSKKIFLFKDVYNKNIDFKKKVLKIQQLISLTNQYTPNNIEVESEQKIENNTNSKDNNSNNKNNNIDLEIDDLEIFRIKNEILSNFYKSESQSNKENTEKDFRFKKNHKINLSKKNNVNNINKNISFNSRCKLNSQEIHKNLILKKDLKTYDISYSLGYNNAFNGKEPNISSDRSSETKREIFKSSHKKSKLIYNFNLYEIIKISFFKCCISKDLKLKNNLNLKANKLLYNKLDIVVYIRTMFLLDIIYHIILDSDRKYIANFISRPIISDDKEINENCFFQKFYKEYAETEFIKSTLGIYKLNRIKNKKNSEQKLIALCNKQLKDIL